MFQIDVNLLALGYAGKILSSITFVGPRYFQYNREVTAVFAVSGVAADLGINPPIFLQTNMTNQKRH